MITHECLPLEPQDGESFIIPEGVQVHAGGFVTIYAEGNPIGEASAFNKVPTMSNLWTLHRVITPSSVDLKFSTPIEVHTIIKSASRVVFEDGIGWYVSAYNTVPIEETVYVGKIASVTAPVFAVGNYFVYELLGFSADKKGEKK